MIRKNDREIEDLKAETNKALNLLGLSKLYPFAIGPRVIRDPDPNYLWIVYSSSEDLKREMNYGLVNKWVVTDEAACLWLILLGENIVIRWRDLKNQKFPYKFPIGFWRNPKIYRLNAPVIPIYINAFCEIIKKVYKKSFRNIIVQIMDLLPYGLSVIIGPTVKREREIVRLKVFDRILNSVSKENKQTMEEIIKDEKKTFKQKLDELITLSSEERESNLSYCLACGVPVDKHKRFCNARKDHKTNKDNCLNKFNYWLEARLGIKSGKGKAKKREVYYKELQHLIKIGPLYAFDTLTQNHPKLYTARYKERWERERKQT